MSATVLNNTRKTLASQLDRLDEILDGLADGMQGAVALTLEQVVSEIVQKAVEAAVRVVLTSPEILAALSRQMPRNDTPAPQKSAWSVKETLKGAAGWIAARAMQQASRARKGLGLAWSWCLNKLRGACTWTSSCGTVLAQAGCALWRFRRSSSAALSVGLLAGVGSYLAGPVAAAILCGLSGVVLTGTALVLVPLARMLWSGETYEV